VTPPSQSSYGWCSLRLRFDERERVLLNGAEQLRGTTLAHGPRPDVLRTALSLAKAGQKVRSVPPGGAVSLEEGELLVLIDALRFSAGEVQNGRGAATDTAFPELVQKGSWRSFGLVREIDALASRLQKVLNG
jgi:hypothetical protein